MKSQLIIKRKGENQTMHYVLLVTVITLYIYFRFGLKALAGSLFILGLLALSRGLIAFAIPLFIMAYYLIRKTDFPLELPWSMNGKANGNISSNVHGPKDPTITSSFIKIVIAPENKEIAGEVLKGLKAGQTLNALSVRDLNELLKLYAKKDKESEQILISYLDSNRENWRAEMTGYYESAVQSSGLSGKMTKRKAIEILGLSSHPTEEEVKTNHRQLMKRFHPDYGGSPFLAAKINTAKDCLLG